ncbi:MAG: hypothetical protein M2R45_03173 [Verrucomicrobia subdivision 3 bacterium]|nr:hypothetical protein [Limisphaerales bacterium]MCS1417752.1 hypothetical protein [Limisphaerales bacterium]
MFPQTIFVSGGLSSEIKDDNNRALKVISSLLEESMVFRLMDRNDQSDAEVEELKKERYLPRPKEA